MPDDAGGYFSGPQIRTCEETGITMYLPKPMTSNSKAHGRFSKADYIYIHRDDEYAVRAIHRAPSDYPAGGGRARLRSDDADGKD